MASLLFFLLPQTCFGAARRNLLTDTYDRAFVSKFCPYNLDWVKLPSYTDRAAWDAIPEAKRQATVTAGEKYLGYEWPSVLPTQYLEFTRNGNRAVVDNRIAQRLNALRALVYAELVEGEGRFLDDIINGVFTYCEQTFWGSSAHFYLYDYGCQIENPVTILPDASNPVIDLTTGDVASTLAWTWYFFHEEFDKVSPIINARLLEEMHKKILDPYYSKNDMWWITGWNVGNVNNWTPWCSYNLLSCILLLETDPQKRLDGIYKTMQSVDLFINSYPDDGGCNEGPSYWSVAVGYMYDYLSLLKTFSGGAIDICKKDIITEMGRYIYKLYIGNGVNYVNFADAPPRITHGGVRIMRYGKDIGDSDMQEFGAFLAKEVNNFGMKAISGEVVSALMDVFEYDSEVPGKEILVGETYMPDLQVAVGRDMKNSKEGFFFAAKGGNNAEQHNHNDVGSFILYYDSKPVLVDPGVGTYTRQTFSGSRYDIWTMQSGYHNLPVINGVMQKAGGDFKAKDSAFKSTSSQVEFSTDISSAYPEEARVSKWIRKYSLKRGKSFSINDNYSLKGTCEGTKIMFITPLDCADKGGKVALEGKDLHLNLGYSQSQVSCTIEEIQMDDSRLESIWGKMLYRIVFDVKSKKAENEITFIVSP